MGHISVSTYFNRSSAMFVPLIIIVSYLLTGCLAGISVPGDSVSKDFDKDYSETHRHWPKQQVVEELGVPSTIYRSDDETFYVYEEKGDVAGIIGIPLVVPPFFVPIWGGDRG